MDTEYLSQQSDSMSWMNVDPTSAEENYFGSLIWERTELSKGTRAWNVPPVLGATAVVKCLLVLSMCVT